MSKYQQYLPQEYEDEYHNNEDELLQDQNYDAQVPMMSQAYDDSQIQSQPQQSFNPYYNGIRAAIEQARASFASTNEQRNRALRSGILSFGQSLGGIEREKGFKNNLLAAGRALAPGIAAYDQFDAANEGMNEQLANKILAEKQVHEAREQQQRNIEADRALKMKMIAQQYGLSERELMERIRHNQAQENMARESLIGRFATEQEEEPTIDANKADLVKLLDNAERVVREKGEAAQYGMGSRIIDKFTPGGYRKNQDQAAIDTIGQILQGDLFKKAFGYTSTAEFEHTPTISSENSPETNLEIIQQLRNRFGLNTPNPEQFIDSKTAIPMPNGSEILMEGPDGSKYLVPAHEMENAKLDGLRRVQ